jgi:putative phosphoribosyl transferase
VATALGGRLDAYAVRKIRTPGHPELALGAVTYDGTVLLNEQVVRAQELTAADVDALTAEALAQARGDAESYRPGRGPVQVRGEQVVLVDDGAATGATVRACVAGARAGGAALVAVALPVAPRETAAVLRREADLVVVLRSPLLFRAVGWAYDDFSEVPADRVRALLRTG